MSRRSTPTGRSTSTWARRWCKGARSTRHLDRKSPHFSRYIHRPFSPLRQSPGAWNTGPRRRITRCPGMTSGMTGDRGTQFRVWFRTMDAPTGRRAHARQRQGRRGPKPRSVPRGAAEAPEARAASPRPSIPRVPTWTSGKMLSRFCFFITFPSQSRPAPSPVTAGFLSLLLSFAPAKEARRAAGGWGAPRQAAAAGRGRGRTMANCGQQPTESNVGRRPSAAAQAAEMQAEPGGGWGGGIGA